MKKVILTLLATAVAMAVMAKDPKPCPSGYYDSALNKSGQALLTALYNIITTHTNIGYDNLWSAYDDTDTDSRGYYIDMYSTYDKYTYNDKCGSYSAIGDCINREHSVPKSWWGSGKLPQYSDIFNIVPTDGYVNNQRSNLPYGVCEGGTRLTNGQYIAKGRKGTSTHDGYSGVVFEPMTSTRETLPAPTSTWQLAITMSSAAGPSQAVTFSLQATVIPCSRLMPWACSWNGIAWIL